ncbi:MAG: aspartate carbamoyltransferase regulatory subunit [Sulfolobales archaeon]
MPVGELIVSKIREGTVIDHIPSGRALDVLNVLRISGKEGYRIAIVMNVESSKLNRKDIVKIEGRYLSKDETDIIALIAPTATINIIKNFEVVETRKVSPPRVISGLIKCPNITCITRHEGIETSFEILSTGLRARCSYCGTELPYPEFIELILKQLGTKT